MLVLYLCGPCASHIPSGIHKWISGTCGLSIYVQSGLSVPVQSSQMCGSCCGDLAPLFWKPKGHGAYLWLEVHFGVGEGKVGRHICLDPLGIQSPSFWTSEGVAWRRFC